MTEYVVIGKKVRPSQLVTKRENTNFIKCRKNNGSLCENKKLLIDVFSGQTIEPWIYVHASNDFMSSMIQTGHCSLISGIFLFPLLKDEC